jgi:hypothetical protein
MLIQQALYNNSNNNTRHTHSNGCHKIHLCVCVCVCVRVCTHSECGAPGYFSSAGIGSIPGVPAVRLATDGLRDDRPLYNHGRSQYLVRDAPPGYGIASTGLSKCN